MRNRLEDAAPSRFEHALDAFRAAPPHPSDQFLAGERLAVQRLADRIDELREFGLVHLDVLEPGVSRPHPVRVHCRREEGEIFGREQMQGAAHEPRLDEPLVFPERSPHIFDAAVGADRDLQLGRGHDLSLHAADVADYASQVTLGRALRQVMARHAKRVDLRPAELRRDRLDAFQSRDNDPTSGRSTSGYMCGIPRTCVQ